MSKDESQTIGFVSTFKQSGGNQFVVFGIYI